MLSWRKEKRREKVSGLFVRMRIGPHNKKVVHSFDLLLYMLAIRWAVHDMALAYSQQLAILLTIRGFFKEQCTYY